MDEDEGYRAAPTLIFTYLDLVSKSLIYNVEAQENRRDPADFDYDLLRLDFQELGDVSKF